MRKATELKTKCQFCGGYFYEDDRDEQMRRCPKTIQRARPRKKAEKPSEKDFFANSEPPSEWVSCPKCNCYVGKENLDGHLRSCRLRENAHSSRPTPPVDQKQESQNMPTSGERIMAQVAAMNAALEKRVVSELKRIAKEAWQATAAVPIFDERLKLAKKEAIRLIGSLSPSLRRKVQHRFTSEKWAPLLSQA